MVRLRMDRRLGKRIDASDIVQEATLDAVQRLEAYLKKPEVDLFSVQQLTYFHLKKKCFVDYQHLY